MEIDPKRRELWEVEIAGGPLGKHAVRLVALPEGSWDGKWDAILAHAMSLVAVHPWPDGMGPSRGTVTRIEHKGSLHVGIPAGFGTGATCCHPGGCGPDGTAVCCGEPQVCWRCGCCEQHCAEDWHKRERE